MRSFETISYLHTLNKHQKNSTRDKERETRTLFKALLLVRVMRIPWSFAAGTGLAASFLLALSDITHIRDS
jgi:hypothetical protein